MTTILVIGATGSIGRHVVGEATASELQVRAVTRDRGCARRMLGDVDLVEGDLTNPASVAPALVGVDAAILTHGGDSAPERVYYGAVAALLDALGDRRLPIALMSSINVTRASGPYTDLMNWKRRGERLLRMSGQPYTIVRPGWFDNISGTVQRLVLQQGTHEPKARSAVTTSPRPCSRPCSIRARRAAPWRRSRYPVIPSPTGRRCSPPPTPIPPARRTASSIPTTCPCGPSRTASGLTSLASAGPNPRPRPAPHTTEGTRVNPPTQHTQPATVHTFARRDHTWQAAESVATTW